MTNYSRYPLNKYDISKAIRILKIKIFKAKTVNPYFKKKLNSNY